MLKIYTRTGDDGDTGLFGGQRVHKDDLRVEAYGTVDELNAVLGVTRTHITFNDGDLDALLQTIQNDLFGLGSDLATPDEKDTDKGRIHITRVAPSQVAYLESQIDHYEGELPPLTNFILPGGSPFAASLHVGRVVCRRAERHCVTLARAHAETAPLNPDVIRYLNRLSDLLFVLCRVANKRRDVPDVVWKS